MSKLYVDEIQPKTTGGVVNMPNRPAFFAKINPEQSNIAINSWVYIPFTNIITNQGNHFGGTVFTAPITGIYHFSTYLRLDNVDTAAAYYLLGWEIGGTIHQADIIDPNFSSDLHLTFDIPVQPCLGATPMHCTCERAAWDQ